MDQKAIILIYVWISWFWKCD